MKSYLHELAPHGLRYRWDEDADCLVLVNEQGERWHMSRLAEKRAEGVRQWALARRVERITQDYRRRHPRVAQESA